MSRNFFAHIFKWGNQTSCEEDLIALLLQVANYNLHLFTRKINIRTRKINLCTRYSAKNSRFIQKAHVLNHGVGRYSLIILQMYYQHFIWHADN